MSRYRKNDVRLYGERWFRSLSGPAPNAKYLWLYLTTGPHTTILPGLFEAGIAGIAEKLRWAIPDTERCFQELFDCGKVHFDEEALVFWIPGLIFSNLPSNQNTIISWRRQWAEVPDCLFKYNFIDELKDVINHCSSNMSLHFRQVFPELNLGLPVGLPVALPSGLGEPNGQGRANTGTGAGTGIKEKEKKEKKKERERVKNEFESFDDLCEWDEN